MKILRLSILLIALCLPLAARGGAGPLNTLVVVNETSRDSRALGAYYAKVHGIPESHVCRIRIESHSPSISLADFETRIRAPIQQHISAHQLDGQIHFLVLCMNAPTRVAGNNGLTAVLFYDYKVTDPEASKPCNIAPDSVNQYYATETAYSSTAGWNRMHAPIPFLLTAKTLETAKAVADRGADSIASEPDGVFCLYGSGDSARNVRHRTYPVVKRHFDLFGWSDRLRVSATGGGIPDKPILGYLTGRAYLPTNLVEAVFAPGAVGDHLTSCAGMIPQPCQGQSSVWDWMELGATASYGTVTEPCAFTAKFPDPMVFFWMARGFTLGEALAMSVRNPYQGIWTGDPLSAPFATPPSVRISAPAEHAIIHGPTNLVLSLKAHDHGVPPVYLDLYVDGRHHAPITRPFAPVGNDLIAQVGPHRFAYTVAPGEDLFAAAAGLAWAINDKGNGKITASARADRIEVTVSEPLNKDGHALPVSAAAEQGFANGLYIGAEARTDHLQIGEDGIGRAALTLHLGSVREYDLTYPLDLSGLDPGFHTLSLVVRDGSAMQCQGQTDLPIRIEKESTVP